ncbi:hypothetical protein [Saccharothrix australiensis]|uniref:Uncharacterized protein n=1 Tax=Saccharothrix australiensis TaxID=2072 RepID=A0A495VZ26_9PSEU|nr:hypothetical protein [Saccharothrix australiensis]RKT53773.1 hypothetical protein C8E97_2352 [Saccharothrix australiensis]
MGNRTEVIQTGRSGGVLVPVVLWSLLVAGVTTNAISSLIGAGGIVHLSAGGAAVLCIVLLVAYYARRRSR